MTLTPYFLSVAWVLLAVLLVIGLIFLLAPRRPPPSASSYRPVPDPWSALQPSSDPVRNVCSTYTFPGTFSGNLFLPGTPTLDPGLLNQATPAPLAPCYYPDQVVAQQVQRTCQAPEGCPGREGAVAPEGKTEVFYSQEACPLTPCPGTLSLVALNFSSPACSPPAAPVCLAVAGGKIAGAPCDPTEENQLWSVIRESVLLPLSSSSGPLAALVYPSTGQALLPLSPVVGSPLQLVSSSSPPAWWLAPSTSSPQQIVYVGNLGGALKQAIAGDTLSSFLSDNDLLSLSVSSSGAVTLQPYDDRPNQAAQYLDYSLYNLIANSPPCPCAGCFPW